LVLAATPINTSEPMILWPDVAAKTRHRSQRSRSSGLSRSSTSKRIAACAARRTRSSHVAPDHGLYGVSLVKRYFMLRSFQHQPSRGGARLGARNVALRPCIRLDPQWTQTMKQPFASAARLRGGRTHSQLRHRSQAARRVLPPRIVIDSRRESGRMPKLCIRSLVVRGR
jgi:hypothetical protein